MRVRFHSLDVATVASDEAGFLSPGQIYLSPGKEYEVHAVSVYDRLVFLQVVDDKSTPIFLPRAIFEVIDPSVPGDWICNVFPDGPVQLVLGPSFIAKDLDSYSAMIDQAEVQVTRFWRRVSEQPS